VEFEDVV
jgi:hypothetical protein